MALLVVFYRPAPGVAAWYRYLVDNTSSNTGTSVAVTAGTPHIAYYASAGLKYACWESGLWNITLVDAFSSTHNGNPSLVFDNSGRPHIAYYRGTPWYARWNGTEWIREQIDTTASGDYISLAFDSLGRPHVAYSKSRGLFYSMLKYAWRDDTGWHTQLVDSLGGTSCVLRFDRSGQSCIAHCASWSDDALYYSRLTQTGWTKETLLVSSTSQCSMVLDGEGQPHISYYWASGGSFDLRYAQPAGDSWRFEIVDPGQQLNKRGWDNSIARDRAGNLHISYHAHNEARLRYACGRSGSWQIEILDTVGLWNLCSSIALDEFDRPYVAYCDENEGNTLYLIAQADLTDLGELSGSNPLPVGTMPTVVSGSLRFSWTSDGEMQQTCKFFSIAGRKIVESVAGSNGIPRLANGEYFLYSGCRGALEKVLVVH